MPDCGAALVEEIALTEAERKQLLSKEQRKRRVPDRKGREAPSVISNGEYRSITEARAAYVTDRIELMYITSMLDEAGIRYRVAAEDAGQYLQILHGRSYIGSIIYVGADDLEEAKRIAQSYHGMLHLAGDEAPPEDSGISMLTGIGVARGCLIWIVIAYRWAGFRIN